MTVDTPDLYGGAARTSKNLVRQVGLSSFTEVAGAATFTADAFDKFEIIFGIGATDDDDEPFGCKTIWEVPCKANPTVSASTECIWNGKGGIIDDTAAGTSLTSSLFDPDDGDAITSASTIDLDNGEVKTVRWVVSGVFEEAYGNPWTNDNVVTFKYNSTSYDKIKLTKTDGTEYPTVSTPSHYTAVAGHKSKSYLFPAVVTTGEIISNIVIDTDDTLDVEDSENASGNITIYMYDGNWFQNNDVTPATIDSGVEDEDAAQVGGSTDFSDTIHVEDD